MKQDEQMSDREKDVRMMESPLGWPMMLLPLKRTANFEVGFMAGNGCKVYEGNIYDAVYMAKVRLGEVQPKEYPSFGAIYDDGWRVD